MTDAVLGSIPLGPQTDLKFYGLIELLEELCLGVADVKVVITSA